MDNSSDTVLTKKLLFVLKPFAVLVRLAAIFIYYAIKDTPSDNHVRNKMAASISLWEERQPSYGPIWKRA